MDYLHTSFTRRTGSDSGISGIRDPPDNPGERNTTIISAQSQEVEIWNFERLASTPMLASAFEEFARRALCQESVQFLVDVFRYQEGDFACASADLGRSGEQYEGFNFIVKTYIANGALGEVNISSEDKKAILDIYQAGQPYFSYMADEERRLVFGQAYREVRLLLEANLLQRFLQSEEFVHVRAQRATVTTLMDSPPIPSDVA
ncbi:unnamed protein product [Choristocarpus tenellus]